jgi:hypothetical protein
LNIKAAITYVPYQDLENKVMLQGFLDDPEDFLNHLRRYTFSLSTQIIFGYRAPSTQDPNLQQLFWVSVNTPEPRNTSLTWLQSFERWGKLAGSASAQLTDLFPVLQRIPKALSPQVRTAQWLHEKEKDLYVRLWMRAKQKLEDGTGHVCSSQPCI